MSDEPQDGIRLEESGGRGRYALDLGGGAAAELTFSRDRDGAMVADHTFVPPRLRGQGIAARLVARAVADAQGSGTRIVPLCPYVAAEFRRHPEWADLLKR